MKDNRDIDREKIDAENIEIRVKTREEGPVMKKISNFWYYHKWKVIIISFFVIVFTVGGFQMCTKEDADDAIIIAGPGFFNNEFNNADMMAIKDILTSLKPRNNDGSAKKLDIYTYSIYSEDELYEANHTIKNEQGNYVPMANNAASVENQRVYTSLLSTGECSVLIISDYLYSTLVDNGRVLPLKDVFGDDLPEGTLADGCGVRLGDTDLYSEYKELRVLDGDMVVCILRSYVMGASSNKERYAESLELFKRIVTYESSASSNGGETVDSEESVEANTEESSEMISESDTEAITEAITEANTEAITEANTETE